MFSGLVLKRTSLQSMLTCDSRLKKENRRRVGIFSCEAVPWGSICSICFKSICSICFGLEVSQLLPSFSVDDRQKSSNGLVFLFPFIPG